MTVAAAIGFTLACYAVLGVLLLSLNFAALWRWWIKAAAIVVTVAAGVGSYFAISGLVGWPSASAMPGRFNLVATRMVEPNEARGEAGHIYLWVEEIDENQFIISAPRAYEVPFKLELAFEVDKAQEVLDGGGSVMGELDTEKTETSGGGSDNAEGLKEGSGGNDGGAATGEGARFDGVKPAGNIVFSDMPAPSLPAKSAPGGESQ